MWLCCPFHYLRPAFLLKDVHVISLASQSAVHPVMPVKEKNANYNCYTKKFTKTYLCYVNKLTF